MRYGRDGVLIARSKVTTLPDIEVFRSTGLHRIGVDGVRGFAASAHCREVGPVGGLDGISPAILVKDKSKCLPGSDLACIGVDSICKLAAFIHAGAGEA